MKTLILGHTRDSLALHTGGLGEITEALKVRALIKECGHHVLEILDVYTLFGGYLSNYLPLSKLNCDLANQGHPVLEGCALKEAEHVYQSIRGYSPEVLVILSWDMTVAALWATGCQRLCPVISKLCVYLENESIPPTLYEPAHLLIVESLLALQKGLEVGIPLSKMLYLPHPYPAEVEHITPDRSYLERLAHKNGKTLPPTKETLVIGIVSRLRKEKNCLEAFRAVAELVERGYPLLLVVKGFFDGNQLELVEEMRSFLYEPWFLWDPEPTPYPVVLREYATFDLVLNISGREGANNFSIESMALGIPTVILDGSTNPYLFKGGAVFVKRDAEIQRAFKEYWAPEKSDLVEKVEMLVRDQTVRKEWGKRGKEMAQKRFSPECVRERLLRALHAVHVSPIVRQKECEALYEQDRKLYEQD